MSSSTVGGLGLFIRLADALSVPDGGFSVDPTNGRDVSDGYALSVFPEYEFVLSGTVEARDIARYMTDHFDALSRENVVFGGWRNPEDGKAYLDVSVLVPTREEAFKLARENGQLAVFDFANATSIPTPELVTA